MNQFKKAKQKALESGHQLENITDLKTAGIKQPVEEKKLPEQPVQAPAKQEPPVVSEPIILEPQPEQTTIQPSVNETPIIPKPTPIQVEAPIIEEPVKIQEPIYEEITVEPIVTPTQVTESIPVPVRIAPAPIVSEETAAYTANIASPAVTTSKPTTAKKSIPNIFAPKNEAKSMRKSLVLKPTSVKIAENYCAKNGGSFNELIQTLLDNFIDEYGL